MSHNLNIQFPVGPQTREIIKETRYLRWLIKDYHAGKLILLDERLKLHHFERYHLQGRDL